MPTTTELGSWAATVLMRRQMSSPDCSTALASTPVGAFSATYLLSAGVNDVGRAPVLGPLGTGPTVAADVAEGAVGGDVGTPSTGAVVTANSGAAAPSREACVLAQPPMMDAAAARAMSLPADVTRSLIHVGENQLRTVCDGRLP